MQRSVRPRANGIIALELKGEDHLVDAGLTDGKHDVMLVTSAGKAIRFVEDSVRAVGRGAQGVRGVKLAAGQKVISLIIVEPGHMLLTATARGYGQRTRLGDYRAIGRAGQGVIGIQVNERNGEVISALQVKDDDEILLITDNGAMIRTPVREISVIGRNTQGVRLIQLSSDERVVGVARVDAP